jgi:hypothetical protein
MAAAGGDKHPARSLQCLDNLPYLHLNALVTSKNHCLLTRDGLHPCNPENLLRSESQGDSAESLIIHQHELQGRKP